MTLVNQDLLGLSKSISDMISRPKILEDDYTEKYGQNYVINSFEYYEDLDKETLLDDRVKDWDKSVYYFGPDQGIQDFARTQPDMQRAIDVCGLMHQLTPRAATQTDYANSISSGAYSGFRDSALMCIRPAGFDSYFNKPMSSKSYQCPGSTLPFEY